MGNLIYHYTGAEALKSILLNQSLWITKSDYLNDKSEQDLIKELISSFFKESGNRMSGKVQKYILDQLENYFSNHNHYILSFSNGNDSLPLWNYYSDSEGYNLGIDKEVLINLFENYFIGIDSDVEISSIKITYNKQKEKEDEKIIKNLLTPFILFKDDDLLSKKEDLDDLLLNLTNRCFSFKDNAYFMEEEERIIVVCKKNSPLIKKEHFRVLRGSFIPYIIFNEEADSDIKIPIDSIKLGPYHTMDVTEKSVLYLMNRIYNSFPKEKITKSNIPSRY